MGLHVIKPWTRLAPALILGLFSGRFLSELWANSTGSNTPGLAGATAVTLMALIAAGWWLRRFSVAHTWPTAVLLLYIFYPEADPRVALFVAAVAMVTAVLSAGWLAPQFLTPGVAGGLMAALFFMLYLATLAPDVLPADNGEFQLVAATLGVAHPPGFPLYTLLAHLMTRLPLPFSPAYQVNLFSAVTSALTLWVVYVTVYKITGRHAASVTAVAALAVSTTFWAQATTANIRSLTALLAALALAAAVWFQTARLESENGHTSDRYLTWLVLALAVGVAHHPSLLFMGVVMVLFALLADPGLLSAPRRWIRPLAAGVVAFLPFFYLPWRAGSGAPGAAPQLTTLSGFLDHALARGFGGDLFYFMAPSLLWQRLLVMGNVMTFQFAGVLLLSMVLGTAVLSWRQRRLGLLLGGSFAIHALVTATYRAPQTVEYMLPAYVPAVICLGYGVGVLLNAVSQRAPLARSAPLFAALLIVVAARQGAQHYASYADFGHNTVARDYAWPLLAHAPPDSLILADWHWATPLWYLQVVEGQRPDVEIRFVPPGAEAYAETWANQIGAALADGRFVVATHFNEMAYAHLPPPEPIGEAFLFRQTARTTLPDGYTAVDYWLSEQVQLLGYALESPVVEMGQEAMVTLAWRPADGVAVPVSLYLHLIGFDGRLYAQDDLLVRPQPQGITLTRFRLTPRPGAAPGDFTLLAGSGDNRLDLATLAVTPMRRPLFTRNPVYRTVVGSQQRLVGYDWDETMPGQARLYLHWQLPSGYVTQVWPASVGAFPPLPAYLGPWGLPSQRWDAAGTRQSRTYVPLGQGIVWVGGGLEAARLRPGQAITVRPQLVSSWPVSSDLVVSVRLIGYEADGFHWAWTDLDDSIPALGGIPTLKWIGNSYVSTAHFVTVADTAYPGQAVGATLRLYDAFTNRPLPILDERIAGQFPWIPLGVAVIGE